MRLHSAVFAVALAASLAALAGDKKPTPAPAAAAEPAPKSGALARGEKLKGLPAVKLAELTSAPEKYEGKTVRVEGTVRRACTKMGCWMELAESADKSAAGVRVIMKGHAFFVPTDSAGAKAAVEGAVTVEVLDEEEAKHFESEGGTTCKGTDGKAREVHVEAVGVELVRS